MNSNSILNIKNIIRNISYKKIKYKVNKILKMETSDEIIRLSKEIISTLL
ncbi:hypothetical protein PPG86_14435 [Thermoanaerobacterium thermosaccharolyticum]